MRTKAVVEVQIPADRGLGNSNCFVRSKVDLLVRHRSSEPLNEHVVAPSAFSVHADGDFFPEQNAGEFAAGELTALIRIENIRFAIPADRLFQSLYTKIGFHRDRYAMGKNQAAEPVNDGYEVNEAAAMGIYVMSVAQT